jgi:hypothetical protein
MRAPAGELTWGGSEILDVCFGVPVQGNIGVFCCIFSFNNKVTFSVNCDPRLVNAERLRQFVHHDFNAALNGTLAEMHRSAAAAGQPK